jgi:NitT/TauT family transport system ATP-binding protein
VHHVTKHYATDRGATHALAPIDLTVAEGEFVGLVGPSGCGKSTLLHVIGGLEPPSTGYVELDGAVVRGPGAEIGLVFQRYTLLPWLSVLNNVRFPHTLRLHRRRADDPEAGGRAAMVEDLLRLVGLWDFRDAYPAELSGGMQQRAAIARAIVSRPAVLLMDEPFGALDAQTREEMQELLLRLIDRHRTTTLFVTHDVDEALLLSDRVAVFSHRPGRIVAQIPVCFARHQRSPDLKADSRFLQQRREVLGHLRRPSQSDAERDSRLERLLTPKGERP